MCKRKRQRVSEMVTPSSVVSRAKREKLNPLRTTSYPTDDEMPVNHKNARKPLDKVDKWIKNNQKDCPHCFKPLLLCN